MSTEKAETGYSSNQSPHGASAAPAPLEMSAGRYLATRFSSLKPPMDRLHNPITLLRMLNFKQWMFFSVAFFG